jgi:hypothetical protein
MYQDSLGRKVLDPLNPCPVIFKIKKSHWAAPDWDISLAFPHTPPDDSIYQQGKGVWVPGRPEFSWPKAPLAKMELEKQVQETGLCPRAESCCPDRGGGWGTSTGRIWLTQTRCCNSQVYNSDTFWHNQGSSTELDLRGWQNPSLSSSLWSSEKWDFTSLWNKKDIWVLGETQRVWKGF